MRLLALNVGGFDKSIGSCLKLVRIPSLPNP